MPSDTEVRVPKPKGPRFSEQTWRRFGAVAALISTSALFIALTSIGFADPTFIERVTIRNSTEYDVQIAFASASGDSWLPVGTAMQRCETTFELVIDQGETWLVGFRAQGVGAAPIAVRRADLERDGWNVTIPDSVGEEFVGAGAPPPPKTPCTT